MHQSQSTILFSFVNYQQVQKVGLGVLRPFDKKNVWIQNYRNGMTFERKIILKEY